MPDAHRRAEDRHEVRAQRGHLRHRLPHGGAGDRNGPRPGRAGHRGGRGGRGAVSPDEAGGLRHHPGLLLLPPGGRRQLRADAQGYLTAPAVSQSTTEG